MELKLKKLHDAKSVVKYRFNRTFMELKCTSSCTGKTTLVVSIVPLWNWNSVARDDNMLWPTSFNRTFMELKLVCSCSDRGEGVFQSYLYGIEIRSRYWSPHSRQSFNRTFMELKFIFTTFYGCGHYIVSIVPLWNWNPVSQWATCQTHQFQSYLYGIEIADGPKGQRGNGIVSIVPLWNWNSIAFCLCGRKEREFQSYLYGIEIAIGSKAADAHHGVSIVPLWNWNALFVFYYIVLQKSFNRTFMELK